MKREFCLYKLLKVKESFQVCLNKIVTQIAEGCRHIAAMNVVHRDIACRNIFISSIENSETQKFFIAKIGDFGMARKLDDSKFLISEGSEQLPWRQSAPEVLSLPSKFSEFSDVWSFGILLWETYSWGEQVFKDKTLNEMIEYYTRDFRFRQEEHGLKKPDFMPEEVEKVMDDCLRISYALRQWFLFPVEII
jgi:serine/threonine protein kinase